MGLLDDAIREHLELKRQHGRIRTRSRDRSARRSARRGAREFAQPEEARRGAAPRRRGRRGAGERPGRRTEPPPRSSRRPNPSRRACPRASRAIPSEPPSRPPRAGHDEDPWLEDEPDEVPGRRGARATRGTRGARRRARTCWRRRRTSSRRRPSTTACGSSRPAARLRLGQVGDRTPLVGRIGLQGAAPADITGEAAQAAPLVTPDRGAGTQAGRFSCPGAPPLSGRLARHGPRGCRRAARSRALSIGHGTAPALPPAVALDRRRRGDDHAQGGAWP